MNIFMKIENVRQERNFDLIWVFSVRSFFLAVSSDKKTTDITDIIDITFYVSTLSDPFRLCTDYLSANQIYILLTKQSLQSDTFLYVAGTVSEMYSFLHGRKVVILFVILKNYIEGMRTPIVLVLHVNVPYCKLCFVDKMSSQTMQE